VSRAEHDSGCRGSAAVFTDERGRLTLADFARIPFAPTRVYVLDAMPAGARRGGHACRTQNRLLVGVAGTATVTLDDGCEARQLELGAGDTIHVPPGTWSEIAAIGEQLTIMVLADGSYDPGDYVRDRSSLPIAAAVAAHTAAS
jgi:oxalate decarboxylase/phosphoglucose isomerase-like protein (cupin superfamily)